MDSYESLAFSYDVLTEDVQYEKRADYLEQLFRRSRIPVRTVLDLACGTGTLTWILAKRGYEMIGVDASEEMLMEASSKQETVAVPPMFLQQPMQKLDLYGTVDAVICCLDSINYLLRPKDVEKTLDRIRLFLAPGGILIFDINSPAKLRSLDGQTFLDEREDVYCVWRTEFRERSLKCFYGVDLFTRNDDGSWERSSEEHEQRLYEPEELISMLSARHFRNIRTYGDCSLRRPKEQEQRIYFSAIRGK